MTRSDWIEEVIGILISCGQQSPRCYAEALAEDYYDVDGTFSPKQAVSEDASYA